MTKRRQACWNTYVLEKSLALSDTNVKYSIFFNLQPMFSWAYA